MKAEVVELEEKVDVMMKEAEASGGVVDVPVLLDGVLVSPPLGFCV